MVIEEQVKENLETALVPVVKRGIVSMNLVNTITAVNGKVNITLASTGLTPSVQKWIKAKVKEVIGSMPEVKNLDIEYVDSKAKDLNNIDHIIAVMSGKGGMGKSLVSGLFAIAPKRQGYEVGILDADITGPSIPKMFRLNNQPSVNESGILPILARSGNEKK